MRKILLLIFAIFISITPAYSNETIQEDSGFSYTCFVRKHLSEEADQLNVFLAKYFAALEDKDIKKLGELYSDKYVSSDMLNKENLLELIQQSWGMTDGLEYSNEIQNIRFDTNFATVEINENLIGLTKEKSEITGDIGLVESSVRTALYLQKFGKGWKIVSDKTLYEETSIRYGKAKDLEVNIYAPEQAFSGEDYSITLETEIPLNTFALGSITSEKIEFPRKRVEEVYRQVSANLNMLERLVKANSDSVNELAVASVSFCTVKKGAFKVPEIDVTGTAVLLKRVNVE